MDGNIPGELKGKYEKNLKSQHFYGTAQPAVLCLFFVTSEMTSSLV